jgi:hypothetical protein
MPPHVYPPYPPLPVRKPARLVWLLTGIAGLAVGAVLGASVTWLGMRPGGFAEKEPPLPVKQGIAAPDKDCVDDIEDPNHPWFRDGWWAGYVDGVPRDMHAADVRALRLAGHQTVGVWLCPPR